MKGWEKPDPETLAYWRHCQTIETAIDRLVTNKPAFVFGWYLAPTAAGACDVYLYSGNDAGSPLIVSLISTIGVELVEHFDPPIYFPAGIFIDIDTNVAMFRLHYLIDPER